MQTLLFQAFGPHHQGAASTISSSGTGSTEQLWLLMYTHTQEYYTYQGFVSSTKLDGLVWLDDGGPDGLLYHCLLAGNVGA